MDYSKKGIENKPDMRYAQNKTEKRLLITTKSSLAEQKRL